MDVADTEYYRGRAADARRREAAASDDASMKAHSEMAQRYEQLADDPDKQVGPDEEPGEWRAWDDVGSPS
jgi:hypothetical protein